MFPNIESTANEIVGKASPLLINIIVLIIGLIVIAFVGILSFITLKKIGKSFIKEEQYCQLQDKFIDMSETYNLMKELYEKSTNITNVSMQFFHDISILVYKNSKNEDIKKTTKETIEAIIYIIPQLIKSSSGENHRCFLWQPDSRKKNLTNIFSSTNGLQKESLSINDSFAGRIYTTGKERYTPNILEDKDYKAKENSKSKYKSLVGVPIKWEEITIAVLTVDAKKEDGFTEEDIDNLYIFASMLSICLLLYK